MSETSQTATSDAEGVIRRIDGPHRLDGPHAAAVLVRIPNVNRPRAQASPAWTGVLSQILSLASLRLTGPWGVVARAAAVVLSPKGAPAAAAGQPLPTDAGADVTADVARRPGMVGAFTGLVRERPGTMIPSMIASMLAAAFGLHMALFSQPPTAPVEPDSLLPPVIETGIPAPGPITAVAPAEGNTPAPNSLGSDEPAWRTPGVYPESTTVPGPVIPGVARLQGRIEPLTPTVDARHEQYRPGVH
jgi:hypothetical protein